MNNTKTVLFSSYPSQYLLESARDELLTEFGEPCSDVDGVELSQEQILEHAEYSLSMAREMFDNDFLDFIFSNDIWILSGYFIDKDNQTTPAGMVFDCIDTLNTTILDSCQYFEVYEEKDKTYILFEMDRYGTGVLEFRALTEHGCEYYHNHYNKQTCKLIEVLKSEKYSESVSIIDTIWSCGGGT